ncbi:MAG: sulfotransferase [Gammaproteobacteria bacterium]|nr:sulfotransferase [Gammaproteobacteria bacterium]
MGNLLNQHPKIVWDAELFKPSRTQGLTDRRGVSSLLVRAPMIHLYQKMIRAGNKGYGFETQLSQLELLNMTLPEYIERLHRLKFGHFIIIERKNHLRRIVSILVGRQTSKWHLNSDETPSAPTRIKLDIHHLQLNWGRNVESRPLVSHLQREHDRMHALKQALSDRRVLHLTYEDDISADPRRAYRRVCEFVGVDCHDVSIRYGKTNTHDLHNLLINFEEVKNALRDTPFEWMVDA